MKRKILLFYVFIWSVSCAEKVIEEPQNLIPAEKMEAILYDLAILNSTKGTAPALLKANNIEFMPFIYKRYGVDSIQFAESDVYYASTPLVYQKIYEAVEAKLEGQVKTLEAQKKRQRDSIKLASQKRKDSLRVLAKLPVKDSLPKK